LEEVLLVGGKMKITKRELKKIIKEEKSRLIQERGMNPALTEIEQLLRYNIVEFVDTYMMSMNIDPSDERQKDRVRQAINNIVDSVI